jgi:UDP-N-acetylmuramoyl-L-alanyl-D-glutamate--2,6-diaminopimelate ligase
MRLDELIAATAESAGEIGAAGDVEITGLSYDSRAVRGGDLFFCVSGFERDGHEFAPQAVAAGAAAPVSYTQLTLPTTPYV